MQYALLASGWMDAPGAVSESTLRILYISGAQRPAHGPHPARNESSCGPRCPTEKVTILRPVI